MRSREGETFEEVHVARESHDSDVEKRLRLVFSRSAALLTTRQARNRVLWMHLLLVFLLLTRSVRFSVVNDGLS